jgi:hypothetical protein
VNDVRSLTFEDLKLIFEEMRSEIHKAVALFSKSRTFRGADCASLL